MSQFKIGDYVKYGPRLAENWGLRVGTVVKTGIFHAHVDFSKGVLGTVSFEDLLVLSKLEIALLELENGKDRNN